MQNNRSLLAQIEFPLNSIEQELIFSPIAKKYFYSLSYSYCITFCCVCMCAHVCVQNLYNKTKGQTPFNFLAIQLIQKFSVLVCVGGKGSFFFAVALLLALRIVSEDSKVFSLDTYVWAFLELCWRKDLHLFLYFSYLFYVSS